MGGMGNILEHGVFQIFYHKKCEAIALSAVDESYILNYEERNAFSYINHSIILLQYSTQTNTIYGETYHLRPKYGRARKDIHFLEKYNMYFR